MFRCFSCVLVILTFISCGSKPVDQSDWTPSEKMQYLMSRGPTAESENPEVYRQTLETSYQAIMNSGDPAQRFAEFFERLTSIYFRTAIKINQFDRELASAPVEPSDRDSIPTLLRSETYVSIQALKAISERLRDRIAFFYTRLNEDRQSALTEARASAENSLRAQEISNIRGKVHESLKNFSQGARAYVMEDVVRDLLDIFAHHASLKTTDTPTELRRLEQDFRSKLRQARYRERVSAELEKLKADSLNDSTINDEISNEQDNFREQYSRLMKASSNRMPSHSGKVHYPTTGAGGNIVGKAFLEKTWVLTFDDGPHKSYSVPIMRHLESLGYEGTFFWLGKHMNSQSAKSVIEYAKRKKHILANHSMTHMDLSKAIDEKAEPIVRAEIIESHKVQTLAYGYSPIFFRCPYGSCTKTQAVREKLAEMGYLHAFWAVDSLDWNKVANPDGPASITQRVKIQMEKVGRGVILYHDIHEQSVVSSKEIATYIKSLEPQGHRHVNLCVAVDEANRDAPNTFCSYLN